MQVKKEKTEYVNVSKIIGIVFIILMLVGFFSCIYMKHGTQFDKSVLPKDYGLELEKIHIVLNEVEEEYVFLYMTDNQANYDEREDLDWFGNIDTRCFRDMNGISAADNLRHWIEYANESNVDAFLIGGDVIDYGTTTNYRMLREQLEKLEMPYIYTYGNHETYVPWENRFDDANEEFVQLFDNNNIEYQIMEFNDFCIMSIKNYQADGTAQVSKKTLEAYLELQLKEKPIILICHVPLCTEETDTLRDVAITQHGDVFVNYNAGMHGEVGASMLMGENCGYELSDTTREFMKEVVKKDSLVVAVLSGHLHAKWQGYINDNIVQYVGDAAFMNKGALIHVSGN